MYWKGCRSSSGPARDTIPPSVWREWIKPWNIKSGWMDSNWKFEAGPSQIHKVGVLPTWL
jgi:hypothetical protein